MSKNEILSATFMELAVNEIEASYGTRVKVNRKSLHKFGQNDSVGTSTVYVNWDGIAPYYPSTNVIDQVSSSSAADTTQQVRIEGMTISGTDLSFSVQQVTLTGQTPVTLATPLARVTRIYCVDGATDTAGDVYVFDGTATAGVPDDLNLVGNIMPQEHQSTMFAGTSVANNNYFIVTRLYTHLGSKSTNSADVQIQIRPPGGVWRTVRGIGVKEAGSDMTLAPYLIIPSNTDIRIRATGSGAGTDVTAGFDGYFADIIS